jgi:hypothetical protein
MPSFTRVINHPLFNIVFFLVARQVTKALPLEDPSYLWGLRALYYVSQTVILLLNLYIIQIIDKKNGKCSQRTHVAQETHRLVFFVDQTVLKYVEPSKQTWDGTTTNDTLVVTNFAGTERRGRDIEGNILT